MISKVYATIAIAAGAALLGAAGAALVQGWRYSGQIEAARADRQADLAAHARGALVATEKSLATAESYRRREAAMRRTVQEADHARALEARSNAAARAAADARTDELQRALAAYVCTPTDPGAADDPGPADGADPTTLGQLLGALVRGYRDATAAAEDHASDVRALLRAWPKEQGVKPQ